MKPNSFFETWFYLLNVHKLAESKNSADHEIESSHVSPEFNLAVGTALHYRNILL